MGAWPALIEKPKVEYLAKEKRDAVTQHHIRIETAPGRHVDDAYLLVPDGKGPFPAVVVVFYEAKTGIGQGKAELRDFAIQLAKRGFVTLSLGGDPNTYYPTKEKCRIQPLSFHAYVAANCFNALANLPSTWTRSASASSAIPTAASGRCSRRACTTGSPAGVVRRRHRLRREARQRQLLGAVVSRLRPGAQGAAQAGHPEREEPAHRARTRR